MGLAFQEQWTGGYRYQVGKPVVTSAWDDGTAPAGVIQFTDGTGDNQANSIFEANFSIAAAAFQLYDLKGGNGEVDVLNIPLAMTKVKGVEIVLTTPPAGGVSLRFGPQNQTNAALLWFQAATADFWQEERDRSAKFDRVTGWALDATHKVIALYNPGAGVVAGFLRVIGCK